MVTKATEEKDIQITLLVESTKASLKDIEKITSLLLETLSHDLQGKTLAITKKEIRVTQSFEVKVNSVSYKILL